MSLCLGAAVVSSCLGLGCGASGAPLPDAGTTSSATVAGASAAPAGVEGEPSDPAIVARLEAVEHGLVGPVTVTGVDLRRPLAERMQHHDVPGISAAVIDGGRIAWAKGWGVLEKGGTAPVDAATLFQAASISKPVTAVAVLGLVGSGALDLDADVNRYLRAWQVPASDQPVTLRALLSHTAGLNAPEQLVYPPGYGPEDPLPTTLQLLTGAAPAISLPVTSLPGTAGTFHYSGGGYAVLQQLVAEQAGKPFAEALEAAVLGPARMTRSTFAQPLPAALAANAARGHDREGRASAVRAPVVPELAAGGLWSTPTDLARFALDLARAYQGESGHLLPPAVAQKMLAPVAEAAPVAPHVGLGMFLREDSGELAFFHAGHNPPGFHAFLVMYPKLGKGAVVMANREGSSAALMNELFAAIAVVHEWPPAARPREKKLVPLTTAELARATGTFELAAGAGKLELALRLAEDVLYYALPGVPERRLYPTGSREFLDPDPDGPVLLRFEADGDRTPFVRVKLLGAAVLEGARVPAR
ncbi:MAG: beta-lactamase family protein [Myxococcales bacterium]|nr:beta-lactamase family protein [Myxococcales bacterium]